MTPPRFDIFIAHAGLDLAAAQQLKSYIGQLRPQTAVFLDKTHLRPGDSWPSTLIEAQKNSAITVALFSVHSAAAHYLQEEVTRGIDLMRLAPDKHRLVPVLLEGNKAHLLNGTASLQWLDAKGPGGLKGVAAEILRGLGGLKQVFWNEYAELLNIEGFQIAYIPLLPKGEDNPISLMLKDISFDLDYRNRKPAAVFRDASKGTEFKKFVNLPSCGLSAWDHSDPSKLAVRFFRTDYLDYLISGEILDTRLPGGHGETFRTRFANLIERGIGSLMSIELTNICGTGVFVISRDGYAVATRHSEESHVYPGRWTFSASGTMKWGASPNPFTEVLVTCRAELNHQLDLDRTSLIGFGADARKLFFQFSFIEDTKLSSSAIEEQIAKSQELRLIKPLERRLVPIHSAANVIDELLNGCWEPAAEAALITICREKFPLADIEREIKQHEKEWRRKRLTDEWDFRAGASGLLAVMSVRYPPKLLKDLSQEFLQSVMRFIGPDIRACRVLELGCGIGRMTKLLAQKATHVIALDLCERMILRARQGLGKLANKVEFKNCFAQDYKSRRRFDVAISCLILVHNVDEPEFQAVVAVACRAEKAVFVFEDVTQGRKASSHTCLRTRDAIKEAFAKHGFKPSRETTLNLHGDEIAFLKFSQTKRQANRQRRTQKAGPKLLNRRATKRMR